MVFFYGSGCLSKMATCNGVPVWSGCSFKQLHTFEPSRKEDPLAGVPNLAALLPV